MSLNYTQSLYTPVFPSLPLHRPSSSSSEPPSSAPNPRSSNLVSSLSQLHLSLAALPAELAPPAYSESETGANRHRLQIEAAYRDARGQPSNGDWCRLYKLVEMTCTRSKFRSSKAQIVHHNVDEDVPWILAETEEEWQEWERAWEQGKLKKNKARSAQAVSRESVNQLEDKDVNASPDRTKAISEKVSSWKAVVEKAVNVEDTTIVDKRQKNVTDSKRPSPLGFLVAKPSTAPSTKKSKVVSTKDVSEAPVVESLSALPENVGASSPKEKQILPGSSELSMPAPTFSQVVTSTPVKRNLKETTIKDSYPLFFASQVFPDRARDQPLSHSPQTSPSRPLFEASQISPRKDKEQPLFDLLSSDPVDEHPPLANQNKRLRLLTPSDVADEGAQILQTQAMFQTQGLVSRPTKRARLSPSSNVSPPVSPPNSSTPVKTSSALVSPAKVLVTPPHSVRKDLGNAKGLFVPELGAMDMSTPEKRPPTLTELLASSQRSKPRPRPPSKKNHNLHFETTPSKSKPPVQQVQMMIDASDKNSVVDKMIEDLPPSPKTYFSSPASSTSSRSEASSFKVQMNHGPFSPPRSPLFTQHPEAFNPSSTGTQVVTCRDVIEGETRAVDLGRTDSLGTFGYNSQIDVDGHVDEVTALLEREVDVSNWYKELQNPSQDPARAIDVFD